MGRAWCNKEEYWAISLTSPIRSRGKDSYTVVRKLQFQVMSNAISRLATQHELDPLQACRLTLPLSVPHVILTDIHNRDRANSLQIWCPIYTDLSLHYLLHGHRSQMALPRRYPVRLQNVQLHVLCVARTMSQTLTLQTAQRHIIIARPRPVFPRLSPSSSFCPSRH